MPEEIRGSGEVRRPSAEVRRPIEKWYLPMGEGKGIQFTLWESNLQMVKTEKNAESGKWETTQEFNLAPIVLKELVWRIPVILEKMDKANKRI